MRIVWHRGDLRTHDHPALTAALEADPVLGVVVLDPAILEHTSARRRALFRRNVRALRDSYEAREGVLVVRYGEPEEALPALVDALPGVDGVHAIASYTPYGVHRDTATARALRSAGVPVRWHDGAYVHSPGSVRSNSDSFYSVYSPFHDRWRALDTPDPVPSPDRIPAPELDPGFDAGDIADEATDVELPEPGEDAALEALEAWVEGGLDTYADARDRLDGSGTSHLSVYLTLGVLSARTALLRAQASRARGRGKWTAELAWRDFMADLLYHRPDLLDTPFNLKWQSFQWTGTDRDFEAWRDGRTGVPAVDAAMTQLRETGWISNRARMIVAQFLTKNLRVDWRRGEAVFKDWLLDGDTASNVGNWQWSAGLGIDNAPYFRVMNPATQAEKHDPNGRWLEAWAPGSEGDPSPTDPIADPRASRKEYLEAAQAVADTDATPEVRRPRLDLATREQLLSVDGVGPETALAILEWAWTGALDDLQAVSGVGPSTTTAIRDRFEIP